jgi:hypothetical protein
MFVATADMITETKIKKTEAYKDLVEALRSIWLTEMLIMNAYTSSSASISNQFVGFTCMFLINIKTNNPQINNEVMIWRGYLVILSNSDFSENRKSAANSNVTPLITD